VRLEHLLSGARPLENKKSGEVDLDSELKLGGIDKEK
jgi:hypothetical protein